MHQIVDYKAWLFKKFTLLSYDKVDILLTVEVVGFDIKGGQKIIGTLDTIDNNLILT